MPGLPLKTTQVQIKEDQCNKRFRTVHVYCAFVQRTVVRDTVG